MKDITNGQNDLRMQSLKIKKCQLKINTCTMELWTSNKWGVASSAIPIMFAWLEGKVYSPVDDLTQVWMDEQLSYLLHTSLLVGPIGSNFWKFYLIKTGFTLDEQVFLVDMFRLFRLEWIFLGVQSVDTVGRCTTSYLLTGLACLWCLVGLAYQGNDNIVFRFILEYSSLRDFGPY
jgi:hypothetical protein